jgi:cell division protein FtsB
MRLLLLVLVALAGLIQYPLWMGRGGWLSVWDMQEHVATQRSINDGLRARNVALLAEVDDLRTGTEAAEERARAELGMMRQGELFVQVLPPDVKPPELKSSTSKPQRPAVPAPAPASTIKPTTYMR